MLSSSKIERSRVNDAIIWTKGEILGRGAYGTVSTKFKIIDFDVICQNACQSHVDVGRNATHILPLWHFKLGVSTVVDLAYKPLALFATDLPIHLGIRQFSVTS